MIAHIHNCANHRYGRFLVSRLHAKQTQQLEAMCGSIQGKIADILPALSCRGEIFLKIRRRAHIGHAHHSGLLMECRLRAHPHYVVDCKLVAENYLTVIVNVNHSVQPRIREAEIIKAKCGLDMTDSLRAHSSGASRCDLPVRWSRDSLQHNRAGHLFHTELIDLWRGQHKFGGFHQL